MKAIPNRAAAIELASIFLIGHIDLAVCATRDVSTSAALFPFYLFGMSWALADWVLADCRRLRLPTFIDHGWFVFYAWPFVVPYHLFRTRGFAKGMLALLGFLALWLAAWLVALVVFFAMR